MRRWLDAAWMRLGLDKEHGGPLDSRLLIPRYVDPQVVEAVLRAEQEEAAAREYNERVDREAETRAQQEEVEAETKAIVDQVDEEEFVELLQSEL